MQTSSLARPSPWPYRLTVALALVTFPLIWVGGLVTTYDAGMAVPDWPGTYGYNLFAYPWQSWLAGPWDLFIEHGHRLLGATAGFIAIALVVACWRSGVPRWLLLASTGALALVIFQGALGGARVLLDERLVAMIHGCVGPLFFAYLAGLMVAVSAWRNAAEPVEPLNDNRIVRAAWTLVGLAYVQLVLGAIVRHFPLTATTQLFRAALWLHLIFAAIVLLQIGVVKWQVWRESTVSQRLRGVSRLLGILVVVQVLLGIGTYIAKYSWPAWMGDYQFAASHIVQEKSLTQSLVTTGHVANGSLIVFCSVLLSMRATRLSVAAPVHKSGAQPADRSSGWTACLREVAA